ncbi:class I adenylate-forming enzyme family protein [Streptomyces sp. NPDC026589]|uniref:class I adenylate-forming enzyme family protein n=1 Tax=Streptomyces sp. NPDC026589 TaxID=3155609 RepID=UPI0034078459
MTPTLFEAFERACTEHGPRTALTEGARRLTYGQFAALVDRRAKELDACLDDARRVVLYAPNSIDYLVSYVALLRTGRVPFLVDAQFGSSELEHIRKSCGTDAVLAAPETVSLLSSAVRTHRLPAHTLTVSVLERHSSDAPELHQDTAVCRFTSGTTGAPKCLEFSHTAVLAAAANWRDGTGLSETDGTLCVAAFTNGLAFNTSLLPTFLAGGRLHLLTTLPTSARLAHAVRATGATRIAAFPLVYEALARSSLPDDSLSGLRLALSAGAPLDPTARSAFTTRFGVRIADYYGIAETGPCTYERDSAVTTGLGTPLPGVSVRTAAPAEGNGAARILVRTASMATRYLNEPGLLERAVDTEGYYRTSDTGSLTDGRLMVTGRLGGPVNIAGRKVDPTEVEASVRTLPGVTDAAVFADRGADGAPVLHLAVASARPLARTDIVRGLRSRIAGYKIPAMITMVEQIPRSAAGKIRLRALLSAVAEISGRTPVTGPKGRP